MVTRQILVLKFWVRVPIAPQRQFLGGISDNGSTPDLHSGSKSSILLFSTNYLGVVQRMIAPFGAEIMQVRVLPPRPNKFQCFVLFLFHTGT